MIRSDGRGNDRIRKITITRNYSKYAEGSCLIELGNTRVLCTATVDETVPSFLKGSGTGWVTAEYGMLPRSCETRVLRNKQSGRTFEIQRLVGRSLRAAVDMNKIGERTIVIDCDVLQADGGTRTASITGGCIAVIDALYTMKKKNMISQIPVNDFVAATSVGIKQNDFLLDLSYEEDSQADVDMNVVLTGRGEFIEIQGTAEGRTFSKEQMDKLLVLAQKGVAELIDIQRGQFKDLVLK